MMGLPQFAAPLRATAAGAWARAVGSRPVRRFAAAARTRPFLTSGLTSGASMWATDVGMQQLTAHEEDGWDWRRSLSMLTWGLVWYGGPQQFFWTRLYPRLIGQGTANQAAMKVVADVVVNPLFAYIPCFYLLTGLVKGYSVDQSLDFLKKEYVEACFGMSAFWAPVQFANFRFVPLHLQTYVVCVANVVNKSWLSWLSNRARVDERHTAAALVATTRPLQDIDLSPSPLVVAAAAATGTAEPAAAAAAALLATAALPQAAVAAAAVAS